MKNDNIIKSNKNKQVEQLKKVNAVSKTIHNHHTRNTKLIQSYLLSEYCIDISIRTIKRYKSIIKKQEKEARRNRRSNIPTPPESKKKESTIIPVSKPKKIKEVSKPVEPVRNWIHCPRNQGHKLPSQSNATVTCGQCGCTYDKQRNVWIDRDGYSKPCGESKKKKNTTACEKVITNSWFKRRLQKGKIVSSLAERYFAGKE